jgi:hypothetical protein
MSAHLETIGNAGVAAATVLAFIFTGWKGGVALFVAGTPVGFVVRGLVGLVLGGDFWGFARGRYPAYGHEVRREQREVRSLMSASPVEQRLYFARIEGRISQLRRSVSRSRKLVAVLEENGKTLEDVEAIYSDMVKSSTGGWVAEAVLQNPKLLNDYFWLKKNATQLELAVTLIDRVRGY